MGRPSSRKMAGRVRSLALLVAAVVFVLAEGDKEVADLSAATNGETRLGDAFSQGMSVKFNEELDVNADEADEKPVERLLDSYTDGNGRLLDSFKINFSKNSEALGETVKKPCKKTNSEKKKVEKIQRKLDKKLEKIDSKVAKKTKSAKKAKTKAFVKAEKKKTGMKK